MRALSLSAFLLVLSAPAAAAPTVDVELLDALSPEAHTALDAELAPIAALQDAVDRARGEVDAAKAGVGGGAEGVSESRDSLKAVRNDAASRGASSTACSGATRSLSRG